MKRLLIISAIVAASVSSSIAAPKLCDVNQMKIVNSALSKAKESMTKAISTLKSTDQSEINRYIEWFGAPSSSTVEQVRKIFERSLALSSLQFYYCPITSEKDVAWDARASYLKKESSGIPLLAGT